MNQTTKMYIEKLKNFDGSYKEFLATITNDEHKMFMQWSELKKFANNRKGEIKMKNRKELKAEYLELINLVEEYKFNKLNAESGLHKESWQKEINDAEDRITEILAEVTILNESERNK